MATATPNDGVIMVAGLTTPAEWVDYFIVEVYPSDVVIGTPGTRITAGTSKVRWLQQQVGSTYPFLNVQQDLIILKGLVAGDDYQLRAGVAAPVSGLITWVATESNVVAGTGIDTGGIIPGPNGSLFGCCDCIDVRAYGAVGDGATDDTVAVQAALNAAAANAGSSAAPTPSSTIDIGTIVCINSGLNCLVKATHLDACTGSGYGACYTALYIDSGVTLRVNGQITLGGGTATDHSWVIIENRNAFGAGDTRVELDGIGTYNVNGSGNRGVGNQLIKHTNLTGGAQADTSAAAILQAGDVAWDAGNMCYVGAQNGTNGPPDVYSFDSSGNLIGHFTTWSLGSWGAFGGLKVLDSPSSGRWLIANNGVINGQSIQGAAISVTGMSAGATTGPVSTGGGYGGLYGAANGGGWDVDNVGNVWVINTPAIFESVIPHNTILTKITYVPGGGSIATFDMTTLHGWTGCSALLFDPVTGYLIIGIQDASGTPMVVQLNPSDMSIVATDTTRSPNLGGNMGADGCYIEKEGDLVTFKKIRASDFSIVQTFTVYDYGFSSAIDEVLYNSAKNYAIARLASGVGYLQLYDLNNQSTTGGFTFSDAASDSGNQLFICYKGYAISPDGTRIVSTVSGGSYGFTDFWLPKGGGGQGSIAFRFDTCTRARVRDISIIDANMAGGYWGNSENPQLLDTYFAGPNISGNAYIFDRCTNGIARDNYIDGTGSLDLVGIADYATQKMRYSGNVLHAVDFHPLYHINTGFEDTTAAVAPYYADVLFTGNVCCDGGGCVLSGAGDNGVRFENNIIENFTGTGLQLGGLSNSSITNNSILKGGVGLAATAIALLSVSILNNNVSGNSVVDIVMPWTSGNTSVLTGNTGSTVVMWNPATDSQIYTSFATRSSVTEGSTGTKAGKVFPLSGPANMNYRVHGDVAPLTQSGTTKNIVIADFSIDYPDKAVSYTGVTIAVTADHGWTTYKVFVDDTYHDGVTDVSYGTTIYDWELSTSQGRMKIGEITLSAAGGGVGTLKSQELRACGVTIDGGGAAVSTGVTDAIQIPFAGTIVGWSVIADQAGSISVDVCKHASSAPPAAPAVPNTTTDKVSASAPIVLSTAQSAAGDATAISTWTTAVAKWDSILFNVTSATTVQRVTLYILIQES